MESSSVVSVGGHCSFTWRSRWPQRSGALPTRPEGKPTRQTAGRLQAAAGYAERTNRGSPDGRDHTVDATSATVANHSSVVLAADHSCVANSIVTLNASVRPKQSSALGEARRRPHSNHARAQSQCGGSQAARTALIYQWPLNGPPRNRPRRAARAVDASSAATTSTMNGKPEMICGTTPSSTTMS